MYGRYYLGGYVKKLTTNIANVDHRCLPGFMRPTAIPAEYMPIALYGKHNGWLVPYIHMFDRRLLAERETAATKTKSMTDAYPFLTDLLCDYAGFSSFMAHYFYLLSKLVSRLIDKLSWVNIFRVSLALFGIIIQCAIDREGEGNRRHFYTYHGSSFTKYIDERVAGMIVPIYAALQMYVLSVLDFNLELSLWQARVIK